MQSSPISDFRALIFMLSANLRSLRSYAVRLKMGEAAEQIGDMIQRVENYSFTIAVVGEFKRGKSTFINALLGCEILPADVLPTSATLNRVIYAPKPSVNIHFWPINGEPEHVEEIPIEQLAHFVTKLTPESGNVAATIREAVVGYPLPSLKHHNVCIIDTPGLSDDATMTAITMGALPEVDATIMVLLADSPFSESEGNFVAQMLDLGLDHVHFVVTAIDRIPAQHRNRVIENISHRIQERIRNYAASKYGVDSDE